MAIYAEVIPNLVVGNFECIADVAVSVATGLDYGLLSDVTTIVNLSRRAYDGQIRDVPMVNMPQSETEPVEGEFPRLAELAEKVVTHIAGLIRVGHTVLLTCDTGRKQAAFAALMYRRQYAPADGLYERVVYVYLGSAERERYLRLLAEVEVHRYDAKNAADDKGFQLPPADKEFYETVSRNRLCLSPQFRKLWDYCCTHSNR